MEKLDDDRLLEEIFSFLDMENGDLLLSVGLTCTRFCHILTENGHLPFVPEWNHESGAFIQNNGGRYSWSCCDKSVDHPGCDQNYDPAIRAENDQVRQEYREDHFDNCSDSREWCDWHCHCGYGDGAYGYCLQSSIFNNRRDNIYSDWDSEEQATDDETMWDE